MEHNKQNSGCKIKICGLFREEDICFANEAKPDYIGFVFSKSRREVTQEQAFLLRQKLNPGIETVGVFVNEAPDRIMDLLRSETIGIVQLHGEEKPKDIAQLKEKAGCPIIKAVPVGGADEVNIEDYIQAGVDFILFDYPRAGSGKTFDWSKLPTTGNLPFFLAGGLCSENVRTAITQTTPFGVDVSSGVETEGKKDKHKMMEIVRRVKNV